MKDGKIKGLDKFEPDTTLQKEKALSELESFILRPYLNNGDIISFSKDEIERYLRIDEKELEAKGINAKTLRVCIATKDFIRENYERILNQIKEREELENEQR